MFEREGRDGTHANTGEARIAGPQRRCPAESRRPFDVLLLDAASRQSLASVRSLGRAGLRVVVGECFAECDPDLPVLSFRSRYSAANVVLASFVDDIVGFADEVVAFVRTHPTRVVLPASDGSIAALLPRRTELAGLGCTLALPSDASLEIANDKDRTLEVAQRLGIDGPKTVRIEGLDDVAPVLSQFDFPVVLKPTISWAAHSLNRLQATEVTSLAEASAVTKTFLDAGAAALAQQWVGGRREGVTMFVLDGEVRAAFAHLEHRTTPALGGASVLRESIAMPEDLYKSSVRLVTEVGIEGLCEVEFRRDAEGRPLLMEINARLAGTIETALQAGIDFPLMVWQWAMGRPPTDDATYKTGVRMRWLRGDMRWLRDNHRRVGRPDSVTCRQAAWAFGAEFFRMPHYDCLDWHDLGPVVAELHTTAVAMRKGRRRDYSPRQGIERGAIHVK